MTNTLPMALLRPCAVMRTTAPVTQQWNTMTAAFARRFCSAPPTSRTNSSPSLISFLQSQKSTLHVRPQRTFTTSTRCFAKVENPNSTVPLTPRKRAVRIGPLPDGEVDKSTIRKIFGPNVSYTDGNNVLRIIHHRRTSGSLADYGVDNLGHRYTSVTQQVAIKGLEWLRREYPIDEARAAEEWAEKEANRIAYELWLADPDNADSKYNDPARVFKEQQEAELEKEAEEQQQQQQVEQRIGLLRVGPSEFEKNIERKRKQRLAAVTKKAEEKEAKAVEEEKMLATGEYVRTPAGTALMKPGQTAYVDVFGREQVSRRKEMIEHYQQKAQTSFKSEEEMLSATTLAQRLYPMTAFVLVLTLLSWGFAHYYIPPSPEYRIWPSFSPTVATLVAVAGVNVLVCAAWRITPLWPIMTRYFMHVPGYPRAVQALLNPFSHVQYEHMLGNMLTLALFGMLCHDLVGRGVFLSTYVTGGAIGTLFTLYWANLGRGPIGSHSVGASAAIYAVVMLYLLLTDMESVKIPFSGEVGFWPKSLAAAVVGLEVWRGIKTGAVKSGFDHASHWGGIVTGASVAGYLRATGFHERRSRAKVEAGGLGDTVQERTQSGESKVVDVGALLKEEAKEVKGGIERVVK